MTPRVKQWMLCSRCYKQLETLYAETKNSAQASFNDQKFLAGT